MAVSKKNVRLVTTITKATDMEIRRLAEKTGLTYRVIVSAALSTGLKMLDVSLDPVKYMTPEMAGALANFSQQVPLAVVTEADEKRMTDDLMLGKAADDAVKPKRGSGAKVSKPKKS